VLDTRTLTIFRWISQLNSVITLKGQIGPEAARSNWSRKVRIDRARGARQSVETANILTSTRPRIQAKNLKMESILLYRGIWPKVRRGRFSVSDVTETTYRPSFIDFCSPRFYIRVVQKEGLLVTNIGLAVFCLVSDIVVALFYSR
jgi:hypothetical protein